jgi:hypothetical protein
MSGGWSSALAPGKVQECMVVTGKSGGGGVTKVISEIQQERHSPHAAYCYNDLAGVKGGAPLAAPSFSSTSRCRATFDAVSTRR